jgi:hypothetical protein
MREYYCPDTAFDGRSTAREQREYEQQLLSLAPSDRSERHCCGSSILKPSLERRRIGWVQFTITATHSLTNRSGT